ncbi:F-box family protein [Striga asiatica]|uniref:F-box family protein n=1 Tax=Striga asiatica TaxID=4170 RepID=A0A5A7P9V6_STRAF|nr:F-box family protein [Striga asiatica]
MTLITNGGLVTENGDKSANLSYGDEDCVDEDEVDFKIGTLIRSSLPEVTPGVQSPPPWSSSAILNSRRLTPPQPDALHAVAFVRGTETMAVATRRDGGATINGHRERTTTQGRSAGGSAELVCVCVCLLCVRRCVFLRVAWLLIQSVPLITKLSASDRNRVSRAANWRFIHRKRALGEITGRPHKSNIGNGNDSLYFNVDNQLFGTMPIPPTGWGCRDNYYLEDTCADDYYFGESCVDDYYFGESCGHLHYIYVRLQFKVYEMRRDYSEWFVKYEVNLFPLLKEAFSILCVVRGEKEEGSFLVVQIPGKAVRYNIVCGTFDVLYEFAGVNSPGRLRYSGVDAFQYVETLCCV